MTIELSWKAWWYHETSSLASAPLSTRIILFLIRLRFLVLAWGFDIYIVYDSGNKRFKRFKSYQLLIITLICITGLFGISLFRRNVYRFTRNFKGDYLMYRRLTLVLLVMFGIICLTSIILLGIITFGQLVKLIFTVLLTGFFLVNESLVFKYSNSSPKWNVVNGVFKFIHTLIGLVIAIPILFLSVWPAITTLQTRILFNQEFSNRFAISKIFAAQRQRMKHDHMT